MEEVDGSNPSRSTKLFEHLPPKTLRELQQEAALQGEGTAPPGDSYGLPSFHRASLLHSF